MNKRIASFDTSFLRRILDNKIILNEYYPKKNYVYVVQDTVIDEMYPRKLEVFYNDEFHLLPDFNELIRGELFGYFYNLREQLKQNAGNLNILLPKLNDNVSEKEKYEKFREKRKSDQEEFLSSLEPLDIGKIEIKLCDIEKNLVEVINNNPFYFELPLNVHESISIKISKNSIISYQKKNTFQRIKVLHLFDNIRQLKAKTPMLYNFFVCERLCSGLKFPLGQKGANKNSLSLNVAGGYQILIERNTLADLRIALGSLYITDTFVTCDKNLAKLVHEFFPWFSSKIELYEKDKKSDKYVLVS